MWEEGGARPYFLTLFTISQEVRVEFTVDGVKTEVNHRHSYDGVPVPVRGTLSDVGLSRRTDEGSPLPTDCHSDYFVVPESYRPPETI